MSGSPYLMVEDVAALLGCSKRTVHERARLGEIRAWLDGAPLELVELPRGGRVVRPRDARRAAA
jgi:excisionase family DNA binding protein